MTSTKMTHTASPIGIRRIIADILQVPESKINFMSTSYGSSSAIRDHIRGEGKVHSYFYVPRYGGVLIFDSARRQFAYEIRTTPLTKYNDGSIEVPIQKAKEYIAEMGGIVGTSKHASKENNVQVIAEGKLMEYYAVKECRIIKHGKNEFRVQVLKNNWTSIKTQDYGHIIKMLEPEQYRPVIARNTVGDKEYVAKLTEFESTIIKIPQEYIDKMRAIALANKI